MYYITLFSIWLVSFFAIVPANPIVRKSPNPKMLRVRSPVSNEAFSDDWPTNVVMVGASQTYGMWVPPDGTTYDLGNIECLGLPAYAIGDCNDITIDKIGIVTGYGPCKFTGNAGYSAILPGNAGDGYSTVGPPQNILTAACGL
ncbi:uncharacterized protein Z518_09167 [Rhinocladiella mackenziei CBS 650.93]|uniref:Ecp2 effector protein domain-containing protein n=1 Tax=Rhinocladiella mackenziei CBS 650.93 TaxID=1442369 RepID=A0A0D2IDV6_9EURO|nr:uncharacterized protein Z518_09167 [Rhinocladiella mackenziei CBS 650.93]KIX01441.1 hypothetical protein Z518_09167 [Rhinocladiella mackenziei CBS 650.93]